VRGASAAEGLGIALACLEGDMERVMILDLRVLVAHLVRRSTSNTS
jgi:hypothetical protein